MQSGVDLEVRFSLTASRYPSIHVGLASFESHFNGIRLEDQPWWDTVDADAGQLAFILTVGETMLDGVVRTCREYGIFGYRVNATFIAPGKFEGTVEYICDNIVFDKGTIVLSRI